MTKATKLSSIILITLLTASCGDVLWNSIHGKDKNQQEDVTTNQETPIPELPPVAEVPTIILPIEIPPVAEVPTIILPIEIPPVAEVPAIVIPPIEIPPIAEVPAIIPPVVEVPPDQVTDTGSTEPIQLAQQDSIENFRYRYRHSPIIDLVIISLLGENSTTSINLTIQPPPEDITPCNNAAIIYAEIPAPEESYKYNSWWLLASSTGLNFYKQDKKVYFYWAKHLAENEIGIVPLDHESILTTPENKKIDLGFVVLPYQWVSIINGYVNVPINPEEQCKK